jgi:hypothetical protein
MGKMAKYEMPEQPEPRHNGKQSKQKNLKKTSQHKLMVGNKLEIDLDYIKSSGV